MLSDSMVGPILPAEDMARAKAFYTEKLGLSVAFENPQGTAYNAGKGTTIFLYPYGKTKAEHTVAGFTVDDVRATVKELRAAGVVFEDY
ncbi:MAG: VOC family protein, partial [Chloroflexi bacterium]|nr:VOC family protein [Chloroflexota bacterium]